MMGSSWAFKITASLIKPTRETLLDYCSYILLTISVIGIARVIIGSEDLKDHCSENGSTFQVYEIKSTASSLIYGNYVKELMFSDEQFNASVNSDRVNFNAYMYYNNTISSTNISTGNDTVLQPEDFYCSKYYQAYFPYILMVESLLLLLTGILWVKMPKVNSLVCEFSDLMHESGRSSWFNNAVHAGSSSYGFTLLEEQDIHNILVVLFHPRTSYSDKAQARSLYEKIQKFCFDHESSKRLWLSYIRKSIIQLIFWLAMTIINIILFVKYEFYIGCDGTYLYCSHDTFLRIIWFLGQMIVLIYGMFNGATLNWINNKSISNGKCSLWKFFWGYSPSSSHPTRVDNQSTFRCRPFSIDGGQRLLFNDIALLLHLVSSSNPKNLASFTIYLHVEWKNKISPSANSGVIQQTFPSAVFLNEDSIGDQANYVTTQSNTTTRPPDYFEEVNEHSLLTDSSFNEE